jgi:hypothetical protein
MTVSADASMHSAAMNDLRSSRLANAQREGFENYADRLVIASSIRWGESRRINRVRVDSNMSREARFQNIAQHA